MRDIHNTPKKLSEMQKASRVRWAAKSEQEQQFVKSMKKIGLEFMQYVPIENKNPPGRPATRPEEVRKKAGRPRKEKPEPLWNRKIDYAKLSEPVEPRQKREYRTKDKNPEPEKAPIVRPPAVYDNHNIYEKYQDVCTPSNSPEALK